PFAAWDRVRADRRGAVDAADLDLVESGVAAALGVAGSPARVEGDAACRALVDQFVCDVASTTDTQRTAAFAVLGARALPFVQACYVADMDARMRAAWRQLFDAEPMTTEAVVPGDLWADLEAFMRAVAMLDA